MLIYVLKNKSQRYFSWFDFETGKCHFSVKPSKFMIFKDYKSANRMRRFLGFNNFVVVPFALIDCSLLHFVKN